MEKNEEIQKSPPTKQVIDIYIFDHHHIEDILINKKLVIYPQTSKRGVTKFKIDLLEPKNLGIFLCNGTNGHQNNSASNGQQLIERKLECQVEFKCQKSQKHENFQIQIPKKGQKDKYFYYSKQLVKVETLAIQQPLIISTDLGGTLVGDIEQTQEFIKLYLKFFYFNKNNKLIYNSGRSMESYNKTKNENNLIDPDFFISRCGVLIFENKAGKYENDEVWTSKANIDWEYDKIQQEVSKLTWLELKKDNEQRPKMCLKYQCTHQQFIDHKHEFEQIEKKLKDQQYRFEAIIRKKAKRHCIDILPIAANKGQALQYLLNKYKINIKHTISFGDTMNDAAMLAKTGQGVLVKNSMEDLKEWMNQLLSKSNNNNNNIQQKEQIQIQNNYKNEIAIEQLIIGQEAPSVSEDYNIKISDYEYAGAMVDSLKNIINQTLNNQQQILKTNL